MTAAPDTKDKVATPQVTDKWRRRGLQTFLAVTAFVWLVPLLWAFYTSLRPFSDTAERGYVSIGGTYNFDNYTQAWTDSEMLKFFINTMWITIPAVILILFFASMAAFALSRFSFRFNLLLLMIFTAGNLLPQQVIITPLYRMFLALPLPEFLSPSGVFYDSYFGIITIHVAFQMGFATFVLSNYMKALPGDLNEAAFVDGASVWRQYWNIILPLTRPPLAALAVLMFTWIYNDFFWALVLMVTGDQRPITSALQNLNGTFFTNNNLVAAGSLLAAIPTLVVFAVLQRQFVAGLTLGSTKG
jgi:multiple sugar transport system permease protein